MDETLEKEYQDYIKNYLNNIFVVSRENKYRNDGYYSSLYVDDIPPSIKRQLMMSNYHEISTRNGYAMVQRNTDGMYNFLREKDMTLGPNWYKVVSNYCNGYARVSSEDNKWNFIDTDGNLVFKEDFYEVDGPTQGRFKVCKKPNEWYYIDKNGIVKSDKYERISNYVDGLAIATKRLPFDRREYVIIDLDGIELFKFKSLSDARTERIFYGDLHALSKSFSKYQNIVVCNTTELKDYKVKFRHKRYTCDNKEDTFDIKYRPIRIYDKRYTLCKDQEKVYLYDRLLNEYEPLGIFEDIEFDENFIYDKKNKKVFFVYEEKFIDLTEYYNENLKGYGTIEVKSDIKFMSKNDFFIEKEKGIKKALQREKERKAQEELEKSMTSEELEMKRLQDEAKRKQKIAEIYEAEAFHELEDVVSKFEKIKELTGENIVRPFKHLFVQVGDHLEFRDIIVLSGFLKHVNFNAVSLKNVKLSGLNLSGTNIRFNPQEIYNKDLSNCNLEGIYFPVTTNFKDVNICGSRFTTDANDRTFDINEDILSEAIYDDRTLLNGVPLITLIEEKENSSKKRT